MNVDDQAAVTPSAKVRYAEVIVDVKSHHVDRPFHYEVPQTLAPLLNVGTRVLVPFGHRTIEGLVVGFSEESPTDRTRPILRVLDEEPPLTEDLVGLVEWMHQQTLCTRAAAVQAVLPSGLRTSTETVYVLSVSGVQALTEDPSNPSMSLSADEQHVLDVLRVDKTIPSTRLKQEKALRKPLKRLMEQGWVEERYAVSQAVHPLRATYVHMHVGADTYHQLSETLPKRSTRQRSVMEWFAQHAGQELPLRDVLTTTGAPRSIVDHFAAEGYVELSDREVLRDPHHAANGQMDVPLCLTAEQQVVYEAVVQPLRRRQELTILLHGVTGSGKTEVYLHAIATCLELGRQAIVLVPEISLTPQMVRRFKGRFGPLVAVLHSRLSAGEKFDEWRRIRRGDAQIVVGARSAVFAPFRDVGLVIIDEEHEPSYKQDESPRYFTRDVAQYRARYHGAVVLLGSATPSLDSMYRATRGEYGLSTLASRVHDRPMPHVDIVDMRLELRSGNHSMFSNRLYEQISSRLQRTEQVVLLLNRRGYSTFVLCRSCGQAVKCPNCDVSLTHHMMGQEERLICHYCGHTALHLKQCPNCQSKAIRHFGTGTQKVEEHLKYAFPDARVVRMDVDTTRTKGAHEQLLGKFGRGEADILLGTQMIAKGLDFPRVTLVGVLAADLTLHLPDFRASERCFQLLTQVAGRAGRDQLPGEVVIQTYNPEHYAIRSAAAQDYHAFYAEEMALREKYCNPPFRQLASFVASHERESIAHATVCCIHDILSRSRDLEVLAPSPAPFARLQGRFRHIVVAKYRDIGLVRDVLAEAYAQGLDFAQVRDATLSMDVNAHTIL